MNDEDLLDDLRSQLEAGQVLVIAGAGVSIGATGNAPAASWAGLLEDGIVRCTRMALVSDGWEQAAREELQSGEVARWLSVAEKVTEALGGRTGGEYGRWLKETVGRLETHDRSVIDALHDLDAPIVTTNYDGLLGGDGRPAYPWTQAAQILEVIRGDRVGIAHLHGYEPIKFGRQGLPGSYGTQGGEAAIRGGTASVPSRRLREGRGQLHQGFGRRRIAAYED